MQLLFILSGLYFSCAQKDKTQQTDSGPVESQDDSGTASMPSSQPESEPGSQPSSEPESQPTAEPEAQPSSEPTSETTSEPTDCSEEINFKECFECFSQEYPAGYNVYASSVIAYCYCGVECEDDCADFCATGGTGSAAPSAECESCVQTVSANQTSQCIGDLSNACLSDSECLAFSSAIGTCPPP